MYIKIFLSLIVLCFFIRFCHAQDRGAQDEVELIEDMIETISEDAEDEDIDYTTLFDDLSNLYQNPINLNNSTKEQLEQLYLLDEILINNLYDNIEKNGKLITIYELQSIDGFDLDIILKILPFVKITKYVDAPNVSVKEVLKNGKHSLFIRYQQVLEEQEGFLPIDDSTYNAKPNSRYLGSKPKLYTRYRFKYNNKISWGITAEKDAGEEFLKGSQPNGYDFYSAHFSLKDFGRLKRFVIGDYHVQLGQGLTFWSGLAFGKSSDVMNIKKNAPILRPYTSVDENLFMRGVGTTIGLDKFEITAFYSQKKIDANISLQDTITDKTLEVTSFQQTGFHSTPSELIDKDAIDEMIYGTNLAYKTRKLNIGVSAVSSTYSAQLNRSLQIYNQFEFSDNNNLNLGVDYNFIYQNFNFFGEASMSKNGGIAYLNGLAASLDPRLSFSLLHRNYQRNYQGLMSVAFGENSKNANEQGIYLGIEAKPIRKWTLLAYYDVFKFPWLSYRADAPSHGNELLVQTVYKPSKVLEMYIRYRREMKQQNTAEDINYIDYLVDRDRQYLRFNLKCKISKSFSLRNRVELSKYQLGNEEAENGYLIVQDITYKSLKSPVSVSFRYALFDTDSYDSRIYSYENDVLYAYSIPAYYYKGTRFYLLLRYKIIKGVDLWVKYSQTYYDDRNVILSSLDEIQGNTKTEIKAQVRFIF